jgi:hypothetical protein
MHIGWFGGRSIFDIESSHFTKLGGVAGEGFLPWETTSLQKEAVVEGGPRGSPLSWVAMDEADQP